MTSRTEFFSKYKDPRWQKRRLEILERDGWTCTLCCESDKPLHVHHAYYEARLDPWEYDTKTLHTLCEDCHDAANDLRRDLHFEIGKLWIEVQFALLHMIARARESCSETDLLVALSESFRTRPSE
jgi:5-methylcytosine-specific restriction endonuclease McrA